MSRLTPQGRANARRSVLAATTHHSPQEGRTYASICVESGAQGDVLVSDQTGANSSTTLNRAQDARAVLDAAISEKDFMQMVIDCARLNGWAVYHPFDSRRSASGYPDLTLAHARYGLIFVETKKEGGRLSAHQCTWRDLLIAAGQRWFLWKPSDWPEVEATLKGEG